MQVILASAKTMRERCPREDIVPSEPLFIKEALSLAHDMSNYSASDLSRLLSCSRSIAETVRQRYKIFGTCEAEIMPSIFAYYGQAYRHLQADAMSADDLAYAQEHMWISSCLYGLLRPLDGVNCYRMEESYALPSTNGLRVSDFWKSRLTKVLIESVRKDDGVLVYLDTEQFRSLFDWEQVRKQITVIEPGFHVIEDGRIKTPAVWAKSCRGAMARFIVQHRITDYNCLKDFSYEGFTYYLGVEKPQFVRRTK